MKVPHKLLEEVLGSLDPETRDRVTRYLAKRAARAAYDEARDRARRGARRVGERLDATFAEVRGRLEEARRRRAAEDEARREAAEVEDELEALKRRVGGGEGEAGS